MAHFKVKVSHKEILIRNIKQRFIAYQPDKLPSPSKLHLAAIGYKNWNN